MAIGLVGEISIKGVEEQVSNDYIGSESNPRHVLGLSGGKDSTALAIHIKNTRPEIFEKLELFFTDTGAELEEIYEYLDKLEEYFGKKIVRLKAYIDEETGKSNFKVVGEEDDSLPFDDILYNKYKGFLPSPRARYCTRELKLNPMKKWIGKDHVVSYVGIRADENRSGMSNTKKVTSVFPFIEDGLVLQDVYDLLEGSVGIPPYYKWRTRSGCYFCFFQRKVEFAILYHLYPEWFEEAKKYENRHSDGRVYSWVYGTSLEEIEKDSIKIIWKYVDNQYYKANKVERSFMKLKIREMEKLIKEGKIREFVDTWDLKRLHDVTGEAKDGCNICVI